MNFIDHLKIRNHPNPAQGSLETPVPGFMTRLRIDILRDEYEHSFNGSNSSQLAYLLDGGAAPELWVLVFLKSLFSSENINFKLFQKRKISKKQI